MKEIDNQYLELMYICCKKKIKSLIVIIYSSDLNKYNLLKY